MTVWNIYFNNFLVGQSKTKNQVIKRLEKSLCRYLNKPDDFIGKDLIKCGEYQAKREMVS